MRTPSPLESKVVTKLLTLFAKILSLNCALRQFKMLNVATLQKAKSERFCDGHGLGTSSLSEDLHLWKDRFDTQAVIRRLLIPLDVSEKLRFVGTFTNSTFFVKNERNAMACLLKPSIQYHY